MDELTDEETQILQFEETWAGQYRSKDEGIRDVFGISPFVYHIRLNALLDNPAAIYAYPMTISRLRRLRQGRHDERRSGGERAEQ